MTFLLRMFCASKRNNELSFGRPIDTFEEVKNNWFQRDFAVVIFVITRIDCDQVALWIDNDSLAAPATF